MSKKWLTDSIYTAPSTIDNVGIFSAHPLRTGDTIYRVIGRYVRNEYSAEFSKMGPNWIGISKELWIDPDPSNPMTYMNHSCEPNSIVTEGLNVVALRGINQDEEILMDYSTTEIDPFWQMACHCQTPTCRKTITAFQFMPMELRQLYRNLMLQSLIADIQVTNRVG